VSAAAGIIFLGAAATGGAFIALCWAQTRLDTTTTAVILTLEPLVGAGLGAALGDTWTATTLAGDHRNQRRCLAARPKWTNRS
jgi:drug/metabolite transporter (DMT)-like permease